MFPSHVFFIIHFSPCSRDCLVIECCDSCWPVYYDFLLSSRPSHKLEPLFIMTWWFGIPALLARSFWIIYGKFWFFHMSPFYQMVFLFLTAEKVMSCWLHSLDLHMMSVTWVWACMWNFTWDKIMFSMVVHMLAFASWEYSIHLQYQ